jgi:parallel beta-helix repeat protein
MDRNYGLLVLCSVLLVACFVGSASAKMWYVDDEGIAANFTRIQDAIDNATTGDTIIVRAGTYAENIDVDKSLTIQSLNGVESTIIQAANSSDHIFDVTADYVTITGFTVRNATLKSGLYLQRYVEHCTICDNKALNNEYGIFLDRFSTNNTIIRNIVSNNKGGIRSEYSSNNTVIANIISCNRWGIHLYYSDYTAVMNNTVANNTGTSVYSSGIYVYPYSDNNTIAGNIVRDNKNGIYVWKSKDNTITANTVTTNTYGLYLKSSSDNVMYLNDFVNNTCNIDSYESANNTLNSEDELSYNLSGTLYTNYLGNYWDDYEVKYPDAEEIDATGIWDTPYNIDGDKDDYPLTVPFEHYKL